MPALEPESVGLQERDDVVGVCVVDLDKNASALRRAEGMSPAAENVRFCPIDIELDEVGSRQSKQPDDLVERHRHHGLRVALVAVARSRCPGVGGECMAALARVFCAICERLKATNARQVKRDWNNHDR